MLEIESLSDDDLTERLRFLVIDEKRCQADVIAHMAVFDQRDLALKKGYCSLFYYCTKALGYSEDEAYKRMQAARIVRRFPRAINRLRERRLTLNALVLLAPHLTPENHRSLLEWTCGKTRREIEVRIAALAPRPNAADVVRHLPASGPGPQGEAIDLCLGALAAEQVAGAVPGAMVAAAEPSSEPPAPPTPAMVAALERIQPTAPGRVRFAFTADDALLLKVERAKALLRHKHPFGRLEEVLGEVLAFYLKRRDPAMKSRLAKRRSAGPRRRRVPQWVKDAVFKRDGGTCAFVSGEGRRCGEEAFLEFDHARPWALGGVSDDPANIRLLCRAHNQARTRASSAAADHRVAQP